MAHSRKKLAVLRLIPLSSLLLLIFAGTLAPSPAAAQATTSSATSPQHSVNLTSPAVVRIVSAVEGQVVCTGCDNDGSDITFPLSGGSYSIGLSGSGVFISPDGYVLTADHVVDLQNSADITQNFIQQAIDEYVKSTGDTADQATQIFQELEQKNLIQVPTKVAAQKVFLSTAYTGPLQNAAQVTSYDITRIVTNSPVDKQDTAIVKVEVHDMPYLSLAAANTIHLQDAVTAVAFPGDADLGDFSTLLQPTSSDVNTINSLLSASVNDGQVTGQKTLPDGTPVYETNGIGNHGSSGGPVIDDNGKIIGFVDAGTDTTRVVFLIPSDVIAEYIRQAGVTNGTTGTFMSEWSKAITDYDATGPCHWTHALAELKKVQSDYSQFGGVQTFLKDAQTKATPSECPPPSNNNALMAAILGIIVIGVAVGAFVLYQRKQAHPAAVPATVSGYLTPTSLPYAGPYEGSYGASAPPPPVVTPASMPSQSTYQPPSGNGPSMPAIGDGGTVTYPSAATVVVKKPVSGERRCLNGHVVHDANARFCPECGAAIQ